MLRDVFLVLYALTCHFEHPNALSNWFHAKLEKSCKSNRIVMFTDWTLFFLHHSDILPLHWCPWYGHTICDCHWSLTIFRYLSVLFSFCGPVTWQRLPTNHATIGIMMASSSQLEISSLAAFVTFRAGLFLTCSQWFITLLFGWFASCTSDGRHFPVRSRVHQSSRAAESSSWHWEVQIIYTIVSSSHQLSSSHHVVVSTSLTRISQHRLRHWDCCTITLTLTMSMERLALVHTPIVAGLLYCYRG